MIAKTLSNGAKGNVDVDYMVKLAKGLKGKTIHIFHDLGLSSQLDDYIAIRIIQFLLKMQHLKKKEGACSIL